MVRSKTMNRRAHRNSMMQLFEVRSEAPAQFMRHIASLEKLTSRKAKRNHTGNANEFVSIRRKLSKIGIRLIASSAYSPESNGLAERVDRMLLTTVKALLKEREMSKGF